MELGKVREFLVEARAKTYAAAGGKVKPVLAGSTQLEYQDEDFLYRDIYYVGNGVFPGLETVYFDNKPVWSMSYFGNFKQITEEEADKVLRAALLDNWETTRLNKHVEWTKNNYKYVCEGSGDMKELEGSESITKDGKQVYFFYYAGGFLEE